MRGFKACIWLISLAVALISTNEIIGQKECAIVIQGWEKPAGYSDSRLGGKPQKNDETNITNSTDALVQGFKSFPGAKVTAIRPNNKMGKTKGEGYKDKEELLRKLEKALCDKDCDDVILAFSGHGALDAAAMAIANVGSPKDYSLLHSHEVAELIKKCKKKVKLMQNSCNSGQFISDLYDSLGEDKSLVEVAMSSCKEGQCAKASIGGAGWFSNNFLKNYYMIITNPNLMKQIQEEAAELKKQAEKNAEEENKKLEEEHKKAKEAKEKAEKEKAEKEKEKAEAEQKAAEAKAAATTAEIDKNKKKIDWLGVNSKSFDKYFNNILELIKTLPDDKKVTEIQELIGLLIKKVEQINIKKNKLPQEGESNITKLVNKVLELSKQLPPKEKLKSLEKLKNALSKIARDGAAGYNTSETQKLIAKHFQIIGKELSKIRKAIKEAEKEASKAPKASTNAKPGDKEKKENEENPKDEEIPKVKPKETPSAMALILHYSFKSAYTKTKRQAKTQDPEEQVNPGPDKSDIKFPSDPPISIWVSPPGLRFTFRKVMVNGKCVITGYVSNPKGVPISPIISKECAKNCSKTEFKFKDRKGKEQNGSITFVKGKKPIVKIGNESKEGEYRTIDVDIKKEKIATEGDKKGQKILVKIGQVKITIRGGEKPSVRGYKIDGKGFPGLTGVKDEVYDEETKTLTFKILIGGKYVEVTIKFLPHDQRTVQIGKSKPYHDHLVMNYNLFDKSGNRIAYASLTQDSIEISGEIWQSNGNFSTSMKGTYLQEGPFIAISNSSELAIFTNYEKELAEVQWSKGKEPLDAQLLYPEPIVDLAEEAVINYDEEEKKVDIDWNLNESSYQENDELIGFQIFRYNDQDDSPKIFDLAKDATTFSDFQVKQGQKYQYQFSVVTKNSNIDDIHQSPRYPHYSRPIILEIELDDEEDDEEKKKPLVPLIVGGAGVVAGGVAILGKGDDEIEGCTDPNSCSYNPEATVDDGSCLYLDCLGECGGGAIVGSPCNDGDDCTVNDIFDSNCDCAGVFEDMDGDGICDADDFCPELDNSLIGTSCDDGDPCTTNDLYTPSCDCEGTFTDGDGDGVCDADDQCPGLDDNLIGTSCDDGDPCTEGDVYNANCECAGVFTDSDNDSICDAEDSCPDLDNSLIGTSCDDGDDCTVNDTWLSTCDCVGTYMDSDNDGVCDADDQCPGLDDSLIGMSCDDGDDCTEGDMYNANCECEGVFMDDDGDGVCNADDQCPGLDDNLIGGPCDDGDDCTVNDTWLANCDCVGTYVDSDSDGICDADDQCPGFDDNLIGTACDDGSDCTINDVYTTSCECEGTPIDSDGDGVCDADDQCPGFDDNLIGTSCDDGDDCTINDIYNNSCQCEGTYSDLDNDGICDADDQCPGLDDGLIGMPCDDGDDCTLNDTYNTSCNCEGIFVDSDNDGVCDADDQCPGTNDSIIGSPCDDGDDCTINDQFNNNCECEGTILDSDSDGICDFDDQCPGFDDNLIGTSCDDGDPCTLSDIYQSNCNCEGIFADTDGDGVCDADDQCPGFDDNLIGTSCDDLDDCTVNDIYQSNCNCEGTFLDADNDGVCDADDQCPGLDDNLIGGPCDDGDDCTINDIYLPNCDCVGVFQDSDGDGVCDAEDQCPGFDNNLIGSPCDDGDDCTINDVIGILCNCGGTLQDADGDGVCDADDLCPGLDDNLIGQPCDDGDDCTINDIWTNDCNCEGTPQTYNATIETTDTFCELDNGTATVTMSPPGSYQFIWDFVPGSSTVIDLISGFHQLEAIDLNTGCSTGYTFNINQGTMPDLFEVTNLVPDPGDGTGMIVIELNNIYDGPYQVCWQGQSVGGNGCDFPLNNGPYTIMGVSDFYNVQVEIFNGAPVPCIHQEVIPIPGANAAQEENVTNKISLWYSNTVYNYGNLQTSERVNVRPNSQIQIQGGLQLLYELSEHYRVGLQLSRDQFRSVNPAKTFIGPVIKWVPWRKESYKTKTN